LGETFNPCSAMLEKTAFTSTKGLFQFNVMAMGLCNGVATFQRLMEYILAGLNWQTCLIYYRRKFFYKTTII
jgi:hypothetical protein